MASSGNPLGSLLVQFAADSSPFDAAIREMTSGVEEAASKISALGLTMETALPLAAIATALAAVGTAAIETGKEYEEAFDTIIARTGETGEALDGLKGNFEAVFVSVPGDAQGVAESISLISDRLHLAGDDVTKLATQLAQLSSFSGGNLPSLTDAVTKMFQNWNVATGDQAAKLDFLNGVAQRTDIDFTQLAGSMASIGNLARLSGVSFEATADQIGMLNAKGIDAQDVFQAISRGISTANKAGADLSTATLPNMIYSIEQAIKSGNGLSVAMEEFQGKAGPKMYEAVKDGLISSTDLAKVSLDKATDSIKKTYDETDTLSRQWTLLGKAIGSFDESLGGVLNGAAKDFVHFLDTAVLGLAAGIYSMTKNTDALNKVNAAYAATNPQIKGASDQLKVWNGDLFESIAANHNLYGSVIQLPAGFTDSAAAIATAKEHTALLTAATKILSEADIQHASDLKSAYIPALLDLGTAQTNVTQYRQAAVQADQNLAQAENTLRDLVASHAASNQQLRTAEDALTAAKASAKTANENLSNAEKTLTASKADDTSITNLLKQATQALADAIKTDHVAAAMSLVTAESAVATAKQTTIEAIQKEQTALAALSAFQNQIGFKDAATEVQLKAAVTTATANVTAARNSEAQAIKDNDAVKIASNALDTDILANAKLLDTFTKGNLIGTNESLLSSMQDLQSAKQKQIDSAGTLRSALQAEQALQASGIVDIKAETDARNAAKVAANNYKQATDDVNAAEAAAQRNYGLSKDAILVLSTSIEGAADAATLWRAAFSTLGLQSAQALQNLAAAADAAFKIIQTSGTASSAQVRLAQIADIQAQINAWGALGLEVPAGQQIMLAQLLQQQKDFIADSVTGFSQLYDTIHSEFTDMWTGLTKNFFSGGGFLSTIETALQQVGSTVISKIIKPFTDQVSSVLSSQLSKLTASLSNWFANELGVGASTAGSAANGAVNPVATILNATSGGAGAGASAAGGAASAVSGGLSSLASTFSIIGGIGSAVSAVTGILSMFGVGNSGDQLDRLNIIANNTSDMDWAIHGPGGLWENTWDIRNQLDILTNAFVTWNRQVLTDIRDAVQKTASGAGTGSGAGGTVVNVNIGTINGTQSPQVLAQQLANTIRRYLPQTAAVGV